MSKVFQVPTPADDHQTITRAAQSLSRAVGTFDDHRANLVSLAGDASKHWEGAAFETFAAAHAGGTAFIDRVATAHQAHAQAHASYGSKVVDAQNAARSSQAAIKSHLESYKSKSHGHMQALHEDINRHLNEAQAKLLKAEHELLSNPVAAAADALSGFGDLAGAGLDSLVGELTSALGHVSSWQPPDIEPVLATMRPGIDKLELLTAQAVIDELASIGDFFASQILDSISDVLNLIGLGAAATVAHDIEQKFAEASAAEYRKAVQAFQELEDTAVQLANEIEQNVTSVLNEACRILLTTVTVAGEIFDHAFGPWDPSGASADRAAADKYQKDLEYRAKVNTMFEMSRNVYSEGKDAPPEGWTRLEADDGPNGGHAVVYQNQDTQAVVVAFQGTDGIGATDDITDDLLNANNLPSPQGIWAAKFAQDTYAKYPNVEFTGHSLGGMNAEIASLVTDRPAITFNAAGVGNGNYANAAIMYAKNHGGRMTDSKITNFSTATDPLTNAQNSTALFPIKIGLHPAEGAQVRVPSKPPTPENLWGHDQSAYDWDAFVPPASENLWGRNLNAFDLDASTGVSGK